MSRLKWTSAIICLCVMTSVAWAQADVAKVKQPPAMPAERPMNGWVGGPYKVKAADVTGDGILDLVVSYYPIDVVTVEKGDGKGHFTRHKLFQIPFDDRTLIDPVYNIDVGDIDGDGLLDLAIGVGGTVLPGHKLEDVPVEVLRKCWPGRVVVARNIGNGTFKRMAQYSSESSAKGVALADLDKDGKLTCSTLRVEADTEATRKSESCISAKGLATGNSDRPWNSKPALRRTMSRPGT